MFSATISSVLRQPRLRADLPVEVLPAGLHVGREMVVHELRLVDRVRPVDAAVRVLHPLLVHLDLVAAGKGDRQAGLVEIAVAGRLVAGHLDVARQRLQPGAGVLPHVRLDAVRDQPLLEGVVPLVHADDDDGADQQGHHDLDEAESRSGPFRVRTWPSVWSLAASLGFPRGERRHRHVVVLVLQRPGCVDLDLHQVADEVGRRGVGGVQVDVRQIPGERQLNAVDGGRLLLPSDQPPAVPSCRSPYSRRDQRRDCRNGGSRPPGPCRGGCSRDRRPPGRGILWPGPGSTGRSPVSGSTAANRSSRSAARGSPG